MITRMTAMCPTTAIGLVCLHKKSRSTFGLCSYAPGDLGTATTGVYLWPVGSHMRARCTEGALRGKGERGGRRDLHDDDHAVTPEKAKWRVVPCCDDDESGNPDVADKTELADQTDGESLTIPPCCCRSAQQKRSSIGLLWPSLLPEVASSMLSGFSRIWPS